MGPAPAQRAALGPVLIADGDRDSRASISALLEQVGYATTQASSGEDVLAAVRRQRPALVILDVRLPGLSGYEVCRELRDEFGERLAIMFVSGDRTEQADRVAGLLLGADDYVVKPFAPDELIARVRRFVARSSHIAPATRAKLTGREQEVLTLLIDGLRQAEIAAELFITQSTVAKHIEHILAKLGVHNRAQAVALAMREKGLPTA